MTAPWPTACAAMNANTPAQAIDEPQTDERKSEVRDADAHRLQHRRLRAQARERKDARRKIQDRVDARHLVEERDQYSEQNRDPQVPRPEFRRGPRSLRCGSDRVSLGRELRLRGLGSDSPQHAKARRGVTLPRDEPARAFG